MKQELGNLMAEDPHQEAINLLTYRINSLTTELTAARAKIERIDLSGIHTCHDKCQRWTCVLMRENKMLTEQRDGLRSAVDYASDQLTAVTEQRDRLAEALEQWQPIETAPKDRSFILSAHPEHGYLITRWLGAREMWDGWAIEPTHWMSLPKLTTP